VDTACNSISYAVDAFLNSTVVKNADPKSIYPPLTIELMSGFYYPSSIQKSIYLYGFNVTFTPYPGQSQVNISGANLSDGFVFISLDSSQRNASVPTVINFINIMLDRFASHILTGVQVSSAVNMSFIDVSITNTPYSHNGAAIYIGSTSNNCFISFENSLFDSNSVDLISLQGCTTTFNNMTLTQSYGNPITINGNGLPTTINNSVITGNISPSNGVVYIYNGKIVVESTIINNNNAIALYISDSDAQMYKTSFTKNGKTSNGAIYISQGTLFMDTCTFTENTGSTGGAITAYQSLLSLANSIFVNNSATQGGVLFQTGNSLTVDNTTMFFNDSLTYRMDNMIYLANTNAIFTNSSLTLARSGQVSSTFTIFNCDSSSIRYNESIITEPNESYLTCDTCKINTDSLYQCPKSDSSSQNSSSSSPSKRKKRKLDLVKILVPIFSALFVVSVIIVIVFIVKNRNRSGYRIIT